MLGDVSAIEVDPSFQCRGIGTQLMRDIIADARRCALPVELEVLHVNPARRLYERLGFGEVGQTQTHVQMELEL